VSDGNDESFDIAGLIARRENDGAGAVFDAFLATFMMFSQP